MSPKRTSEPPGLSILSPASSLAGGNGGAKASVQYIGSDPLMASGQDEDEIDLDEAQFAHISVEEDSQTDAAGFDAAMANLDLEVEDEDDDADQFNEEDFQRFREQVEGVEEAIYGSGGSLDDIQVAMNGSPPLGEGCHQAPTAVRDNH